ncbi:MAG: Nucleoside triphosphate pyrophosphohydrolase MazG [Candidatus Bipolaricaulis sibiricus]|uniref:Nucleoside triphosphate pyrophosphohydrolase MazG n=1 Tax=Bipolaricaulis sibiricus TaxID=2501609 RepID=A0A410FTE3_BIPS1|nr:MAG: Nucleoside triphosphate pyrophosphohydrolase MazG [Candidatus Bipolaricaulis sibiricus]
MSERPALRDPLAALDDLLAVIARLRGPTGCPWDRAQTHRSLVPYLLEEAYEAAEAITDGTVAEMQDELGDVLLQVLLHAQIEAEAGRFGIGEVADTLREKLVRRHPHVFGEGQADSVEAVRKRWEELKEHEPRPTRARTRPALVRAAKFVELREAAGRPIEVRAPLAAPDGTADPERTVAEILVEAVALARRLGCDPELALQRFVAEQERNG